MNGSSTILFIGSIVFFSAAIASFFFIKKLIDSNYLLPDKPNQRSSHETPTPRGGGVGFVISTTIILLFTLPIMSNINMFSNIKNYIYILACSTLVGFIGFIDDRKNISFKMRLLIEGLLTAFLIYQGMKWTQFSFAGFDFVLPPQLQWALTLFWVLWVTNLFNFMDGINGIASINGAIYCLLIGISAFVFSDYITLITSLTLAGGISGFIPFNFPRAKIFMGDIGSLFIGFYLAVMPLHIHNIDRAFSLVPVLIIIAPFFLDTSITLVLRTLRLENIFQAHCSHFYQRLNRKLGSHSKVTIIYTSLSLLSGSLALLFIGNITG